MEDKLCKITQLYRETFSDTTFYPSLSLLILIYKYTDV